MNLVEDTHALWASKTSGCPSALPFSVRPPTKFQHEGKTYSLPPSYELPVNTVSGLIINCCYHISLVVTRIPIRGWRFFTAPNTYAAFHLLDSHKALTCPPQNLRSFQIHRPCTPLAARAALHRGFLLRRENDAGGVAAGRHPSAAT